jgi:DNA-binding NarL/FixJ family response regulator
MTDIDRISNDHPQDSILLRRVARSAEPPIEIAPAGAADAWKDALLEAALGLGAGAAVVVGPSGNVVLANHAAKASLESDRDATLARIAAKRRARRGLRKAHRAHELVVLEPTLQDIRHRTEAVGRRLALTPREREVLLHLVTGASNRAIANELGCAEKTIEIHVSRILAASDCPTRASVVARFWMGRLDAD